VVLVIQRMACASAAVPTQVAAIAPMANAGIAATPTVLVSVQTGVTVTALWVNAHATKVISMVLVAKNRARPKK